MYESNVTLIIYYLYTICTDWGHGYCPMLALDHWPIHTYIHFLFTYAHHYNYIDNALLYTQYSKYLYYYIPLLLMSIPPLCISTPCNRLCFKICTYAGMWLVSLFGSCSILNNITYFLRIALMIYDAHIIHFHTYDAMSVALDQSYFANPDYLAVHCWIQATLLDSTINKVSWCTKCMEICLDLPGVGVLHAKWHSLSLHCGNPK